MSLNSLVEAVAAIQKAETPSRLPDLSDTGAMMSMQRTGENGSPTTSSDPMQSALATALANQILAQQQQQQQQQSGQSMQMQVPLSPNGQGQSGMTVSDAELKRQKRLMRNRISAKMWRNKKRARMEELERAVVQLARMNADLQRQNTVLLQHNRSLRDIVALTNEPSIIQRADEITSQFGMELQKPQSATSQMPLLSGLQVGPLAPSTSGSGSQSSGTTAIEIARVLQAANQQPGNPSPMMGLTTATPAQQAQPRGA